MQSVEGRRAKLAPGFYTFPLRRRPFEFAMNSSFVFFIFRVCTPPDPAATGLGHSGLNPFHVIFCSSFCDQLTWQVWSRRFYCAAAPIPPFNPPHPFLPQVSRETFVLAYLVSCTALFSNVRSAHLFLGLRGTPAHSYFHRRWLSLHSTISDGTLDSDIGHCPNPRFFPHD